MANDISAVNRTGFSLFLETYNELHVARDDHSVNFQRDGEI
jgi:hypothetical protein